MTDIILPWPPREVWPNHRSKSHWARVNGIKKARRWAAIAARASGAKAPVGQAINLCLTFYPKPSGRIPDLDNCMSSAKAYLDGIAEAWGIDDRHFIPTVNIAGRVPNGQVIVSVRT